MGVGGWGEESARSPQPGNLSLFRFVFVSCLSLGASEPLSDLKRKEPGGAMSQPLLKKYNQGVHHTERLTQCNYSMNEPSSFSSKPHGRPLQHTVSMSMGE